MTFIVAECGINHNGSIEEAFCLVNAAKYAGADAVKFQSYHTDLRVSKDNPAYDILKKCELTEDDQVELIEHCKDVGIEFFSTPFDEHSLHFLIDQNIKRIKLSSFDITNHSFLRKVNEYGKALPELEVIISTGMSNMEEVIGATNSLADVKNLVVMYCISAYPVIEEQDLNMASILSIYEKFGGRVEVGYSNHHRSYEIPALSVLMGAKVVECHFMTNNSCVDAAVSLDLPMFASMVDLIKRYEKIMGDGKLGMKDIEKDAMIFRRNTV